MSESRKAVVLLSGGLDSATCLAIARNEGYECYAMTFDYGQRHESELAAAKRVVEHLGAMDLKTIHINMGDIGGSALTDKNIEVPVAPTSGIPVTYVPARNTVFLSLALGWAEVLDADAIFIGVNAVDYSGYPDCRPAFIEAFENLANLATKKGVEGRPIQVKSPLLTLSKAEIIKQGVALGVDYGLTVSCYQADKDGRACGACDSCRLRRQGFEMANVSDPTPYQSA